MTEISNMLAKRRLLERITKMKFIQLHNHSEGMTYLIPTESINYVVGWEAGTKVILKYAIGGITNIDVDEDLETISSMLE